MNKRILLLGGAYAQIPMIKEAKSRGYYVITCDYLPNNPGHKFADEYYNVSTTDYQGVLELAKKIKPDFVMAYASDPAAPIAAYVAEKLGLPGNPYHSIRILSEKDLFRNFLEENGFNTPKSVVIAQNDNAIEKIKLLQLPIIIKPTDSSGSKGVSRIDHCDQIPQAIEYALTFSRNQRIIAEEFIDNEIADIHGDGFVENGELVFSYLGDHIYNVKSNPFNPIGTLWPSELPNEQIEKIQKDVARIIKESGYKNGPINIEARINSKGDQYIMEIGPRSGGHFVPQAICYATGFDMVKAALDVLDDKCLDLRETFKKYSAYYAIHSDTKGILKDLSISAELKPFIKEFHQYLFPGDTVNCFNGANSALGVLLINFDSNMSMKSIIKKIDSYINIDIL